jgi:dihydropteroate synthase
MGVIDDRGQSPEDVRLEAKCLVAQGADLVEHGGVVLDAGLRAVTDELPPLVETDDVAAMAVSVVMGCRLIRTHQVRAARRVCDVLAAVERARAR